MVASNKKNLYLFEYKTKDGNTTRIYRKDNKLIHYFYTKNKVYKEDGTTFPNGLKHEFYAWNLDTNRFYSYIKYINKAGKESISKSILSALSYRERVTSYTKDRPFYSGGHKWYKRAGIKAFNKFWKKQLGDGDGFIDALFRKKYPCYTILGFPKTELNNWINYRYISMICQKNKNRDFEKEIRLVPGKKLRAMMYDKPLLLLRYKALRGIGLDNIDLLQKELSKEIHYYMDYLNYSIKAKRFMKSLKKINPVLHLKLIRDNGVAVDMFDEYRSINELGRLYNLCEVSDAEIRECKSYADIHDLLVDTINKVDIDNKLNYGLNLSFSVCDVVVPQRYRDLKKIGSDFNNCAYSYRGSDQYKVIALYKNDKPYLCIRLKGKRIVEVKKRFNYLPEKEDLKVLQQFALENDLKVAI